MAYQIGAVLAGSGEDPCCCEPQECCLYPGQAFVDGLYPPTDLPATLLITIDGGGPYTLTQSPTPPYYSGSGGGFNITIQEGWRVYLDAGTPDEQYFDFDCLVSTTFVPGEGATAVINSTEDEFPDTIHIYWDTGDEIFEADVNRDTNCRWEGTDGDGNFYEIIYQGSPDFQWVFQFTPAGGGAGHSAIKSGNQDTPLGAYDDGMIAS